MSALAASTGWWRCGELCGVDAHAEERAQLRVQIWRGEFVPITSSRYSFQDSLAGEFRRHLQRD